MKIERIKSILLIILVISSIVLTMNKWFNEKLWPDGYSFFSSVKNYFSPEPKQSTSGFNPNEEVLKPARLIVNTSDNHILLTKSTSNYDNICVQLKSVIAKAMKSKNIITADITEWNNHLKSKSIYFSYPVMYDASYFASQISAGYSGGTKYFKEFLVANDPRVPSVMYVYAKDAESEKIEKIIINHDDDIIDSMINSINEKSDSISYYSFELNFDANTDNTVKEHTVIDHDVLIDITQRKESILKAVNLFDNIASNAELYSPVLSKFKYNTSNIRKYVESDDSIVFVENYGTLKLHSNGLLSYKSDDENKGIALNTASTNTSINSCITFANDVTALMNKSGTMYYEISSDIHDISGQNFTLTFDYYINDNIIIIPEDKYSVKNAITIKVVNGKIVSYDQIFVSYEATDEKISCGSAIDAIDRLGTDAEKPDYTVSDIFIAYNYDKSKNLWIPRWYIEDSNGIISMISSETGV